MIRYKNKIEKMRIRKYREVISKRILFWNPYAKTFY